MTDSRWRLAAVTGVVVLVVDQITKTIVQHTIALHRSIELAPIATLTFVWNTGMAFGLLAGAPSARRTLMFLGASALAFAAIVLLIRDARPEQRALVAALGGVLGGAVGNVVCRLRFGAVVDFIDLHVGDLHWPAFNVADAAISVGGVLVLLNWLADAWRDHRRRSEVVADR